MHWEGLGLAKSNTSFFIVNKYLGGPSSLRSHTFVKFCISSLSQKSQHYLKTPINDKPFNNIKCKNVKFQQLLSVESDQVSVVMVR